MVCSAHTASIIHLSVCGESSVLCESAWGRFHLFPVKGQRIQIVWGAEASSYVILSIQTNWHASLNLACWLSFSCHTYSLTELLLHVVLLPIFYYLYCYFAIVLSPRDIKHVILLALVLIKDKEIFWGSFRLVLCTLQGGQKSDMVSICRSI